MGKMTIIRYSKSFLRDDVSLSVAAGLKEHLLLEASHLLRNQHLNQIWMKIIAVARGDHRCWIDYRYLSDSWSLRIVN